MTGRVFSEGDRCSSRMQPGSIQEVGWAVVGVGVNNEAIQNILPQQSRQVKEEGNCMNVMFRGFLT